MVVRAGINRSHFAIISCKALAAKKPLRLPLSLRILCPIITALSGSLSFPSLSTVLYLQDGCLISALVRQHNQRLKQSSADELYYNHIILSLLHMYLLFDSTRQLSVNTTLPAPGLMETIMGYFSNMRSNKELKRTNVVLEVYFMDYSKDLYVPTRLWRPIL